MLERLQDVNTQPQPRFTPNIPPMPEVVRRLLELLKKPEVSSGEVAEVIAKDVRLAAEVLKVINSPLFGMRNNIHSVETAVVLLGLVNVTNIIRGVMLRGNDQFSGNKRFDRFWDTATDVALASAYLAKRLTGIHPDVAYAMGLFHDAGIPLLIQQLPGYQEQLREAELEQGMSITQLEQQCFSIDHSKVGLLVAKEWMLSPQLQQVILHHHEFEFMIQTHREFDEEVIMLTAILKMAEHISNRFRGLAFRELVKDVEWETIGPVVLDYIKLEEVEFIDHADHVIGILTKG